MSSDDGSASLSEQNLLDLLELVEAQQGKAQKLLDAAQIQSQAIDAQRRQVNQVLTDLPATIGAAIAPLADQLSRIEGAAQGVAPAPRPSTDHHRTPTSPAPADHKLTTVALAGAVVVILVLLLAATTSLLLSERHEVEALRIDNAAMKVQLADAAGRDKKAK